ncbi:hypothetical protein MHO82_25020 [Vibrio sp. Of7-15]|nr:hypothetical protein [Vibrio sp. Of7-15]
MELVLYSEWYFCDYLYRGLGVFKFLLPALFIIFPISSHASSTEAVVLGYMEALKKGQYTIASGYVDKRDLEAVKETFVTLAIKADSKGKFGELKQAPFFDYQTVDDLRQESSTVFFGKILKFSSEQDPRANSIIKLANFEYVGAVDDSQSSGYAVYKTIVNRQGNQLVIPDLIEIKKQGGVVKIATNAKMQAMIKAIKSSI